MKWLMSLFVLGLAASPVWASQYEFAILKMTSNAGLSWTDKSGVRGDTEPGAASANLFVELSGEDIKLAGSPQAMPLVLNGLSKKGWDVVSASEGSKGELVVVLKHEARISPLQAARETTGRAATGTASETEVQHAITFTGGHETDPRDHGRPVVLVAAALNVPSDVFRDAFTHVTPAGPGKEPETAQVQKNKQALMERLNPLGVTNDRLDEVSNFYRYSRSRGQQLWRNTPAAAYAIVRNGVVTSVTITNPGAGYTTRPTLSVEGTPNAKLTATLAFSTDFSKNGSVSQIAIEPDNSAAR